MVGENIKVDVYPTAQAIRMAQDQGLDLVEISPNADPPVCKVIDYSKFKYKTQRNKSKREKGKEEEAEGDQGQCPEDGCEGDSIWP